MGNYKVYTNKKSLYKFNKNIVLSIDIFMYVLCLGKIKNLYIWQK